MWEISSSLADRLFVLSNAVLILGAATVLIGTIGTIVMSGVREQFANERISANETATAQATAESELARRDAAATTERAAVAEQRAAEANLEIVRLKTPRSISADEAGRIADKLSQFGNTPFVMTVFNDPEATALLSQIDATLTLAGWSEIPWHESPIIYRRADKPAVGLNSLTGLFVQADASRSVDLGLAATELADALTAEGLEAILQVGQMPYGMDKDAIHIQIGKKPL
jgi:hypothetical protein